MDADQIVERMGGTMVDVTEEEGYTDMELAFLDNNADEEEKEDALLVRTAVEHGVVSACDSPSRKTTLKTIAAAGLKEEWGEVAESSTPSPTTSSPSSHPDDDNDEIFQSAISLEQQQEPQHNNNNNGKSIKNDDRHPPPLPQQQKTAKKPAAFRTLSEIDSEIDRIVASSITASSGGSGGGNGGFWGRRESSSSSSSSAAAEHSSSPNPCSGKFMCTK